MFREEDSALPNYARRQVCHGCANITNARCILLMTLNFVVILEKAKTQYRVSFGAPKRGLLDSLSFMLANPRVSIPISCFPDS